MKFKPIVLSPPHHAVIDHWLSFQNGKCIYAYAPLPFQSSKAPKCTIDAVLDYVVRVKLAAVVDLDTHKNWTHHAFTSSSSSIFSLQMGQEVPPLAFQTPTQSAWKVWPQAVVWFALAGVLWKSWKQIEHESSATTSFCFRTEFSGLLTAAGVGRSLAVMMRYSQSTMFPPGTKYSYRFSALYHRLTILLLEVSSFSEAGGLLSITLAPAGGPCLQNLVWSC